MQARRRVDDMSALSHVLLLERNREAVVTYHRDCARMLFEPCDVGLGAFYYFASVPIIGVMSYAGYGRDVAVMALFFAVLVIVMLLTHLSMLLSRRVSTFISEYGEPYAAVLAALAVACAGLSTLHGIGTPLLLVCAVLAGGVCAATVGRWMETFSVGGLRPSAFVVSPALCWAVLFYVFYRALQFFSASLASGWQVAVPLVGMASLLVAYSPDYQALEGNLARRRSFVLLVAVGAVFATCAGFLGLASDYPGSWTRVAFTPMVFAEVCGVATMIGICLVMRRFGSRIPTFVGRLLVLVPPLVLGSVSGVLPGGGDTSNFLWEASVWVLLLAVFVCGMRTSLFALRGLAIGVMWEAWCVGQAAAHLAELVGSACLFVALVVLYLLIAFWQMTASRGRACVAPGVENAAAATPCLDDAQADRHPSGEDAPASTYERIAQDHDLSARELEVLILLGDGRSAKYVSEALTISFNTARSHIRHIYEKLDVHSKQELIDMVKGHEE